ncbi:hypothetical protein Lser_V15G27641 [Lactuca serriola]
MPFGLKNAGATYQRLVVAMFSKQIGRDIEVYVDDMVIKSEGEERMLQDVGETFKTLEEAKMKLNPNKYTFGVEEVVAVDYFTKWIEAEPLACIIGRHIIKFVWKNIMTRFGTPKILISDNGLQFAENPFKEWCASKGINQRFTSVTHPQANGQKEVSNRTIVNGIKKRLGKAKGNRTEEIPTVLSLYRTTPRTSTQETPFNLTY